jgi:hypothetical protein
MIAGREGDDAARALIGAEQQQAVGRAAQLEAAALLQAFGLDPDSPPLPFERQQGRLRDRAGGLPQQSHRSSTVVSPLHKPL